MKREFMVCSICERRQSSLNFLNNTSYICASCRAKIRAEKTLSPSLSKETSLEERKHRLRVYWLKQEAIAYKGGKCERCGLVEREVIEVYEFHHKLPSTKSFVIARALRSLGSRIASTMSIDSIKPELDKCILLCANCHRFEHYSDKRLPFYPEESFSVEVVTKRRKRSRS